MTFQEAARQFISRLTPEGKRRAARVRETGEIASLLASKSKLEGRVRHGIADYQVKLELSEVGLTHQVRPGAKHADSIAAALLVKEYPDLEAEMQNNGAREVDDSADLLKTLLDKLDRPLTVEERAYWQQLQRRWDQFKQSGLIHDFDMVRFHPRWVGASSEPLDMWPAPPATMGEFWNLVSWHFRQRRLKPPAFLDPITDRDRAEAVMATWRRKQEVRDWKTRLTEVPPKPSNSRPAPLRILVTPQDLRLQEFNEPDGWNHVEVENLAVWQRQWEEGALRFDGASWIVWQFWKQASETASELDNRLDLALPHVAAELGRFWLAFRDLPDTHSLATLEERPLREGPALHWVCTENEIDGVVETYDIWLQNDEGEKPSAPLRPLNSNPSFYLGYEQIYQGPPPCLPRDTATTHQIPAEALESESGVAFLQRLGAKLPDRINRMKRDVPLTPKVSGKLLRQESGGKEQVILTVTAESEDGKRVEQLTPNGWTAIRDEGAPGEIRSYMRELSEQVAEHVRKLPVVYDEFQRGFRCRVSRNFAERFFDWADNMPGGIVLNLEDSRLQSILADPVRAGVHFDIQEGAADWFDLKVRLDVAHLNLTERELRELIQARGRHVRMADGHWMRLRVEVDPEWEEAAAHLGLDLHETKPVSHRYHLMQLIGQDLIMDDRPDLRERLRSRLEEQRAGVRETPPESLKAVLRPYQVEGFEFLASLAKAGLGGVLADDMGLGKTVQSLAWILWLRNRHGDSPPPALVVCPKTVVDVWHSETLRFCPTLRVHTVRALPIDYNETKKADLVVMNYAGLRREVEKLREIDWLAVILDEGQHIKNPDSLSAISARALNTPNRLVLSGTPVENRMLDLWSLMQFAVPGALGERAWFVKRYDRRRDASASDQLAGRIRPFLLRRTKEQVLADLPPRTEEDLVCPMTRTQRKLYREEIHLIQNRLLATLGRPGFQTQIAVLQGLTRLRQIACDPRLIDKQAKEEDSAKLNALMEHSAEVLESGNKILVFSQFVTMLHLIEQRLEKEKIPHWTLTGKTRDRSGVVNAFQDHKGPGVFLLSLKAGGTGLNLTSASYVFLYDPWWNPAAERQAIDRTHRIGQDSPVFAYRLIARNTVEQKIRLLQEKKQRLSDQILGSADFTRNLSEDDIRYLFSFDE